MKIVNLSEDSLTFGWVIAKLPPKVKPILPGLTASFFVKGTYRLKSGQPAEPWGPQPEFPQGDKNHANDPAQGLAYASDFVPFKPVADFALAGTAYPPSDGRLDPFPVQLRVGTRTKSILVHGYRQWNEQGRLNFTPGRTVKREPVPLTYANAWGGPEYARNPVGKGHSTQEMHRLDLFHAQVMQPNAQMEPAGFAPFSPSWPQRTGKWGTYDEAWLQERWPWLPDDFDFSFFNAVPQDQWWNGYLRGDEELGFLNMHPGLPSWSGQLPCVRARCFLNQLTPQGERFSEVPLDLDTVWMNTDEDKLVLVWRGRAPITSLKLRDISQALILSEPLNSLPKDPDFFRSLLLSKLAAERAPDPSIPLVDPGLREKIEAELNDVRAELTREIEAAKKEADAYLRYVQDEHTRELEKGLAMIRKDAADPRQTQLPEDPLPQDWQQLLESAYQTAKLDHEASPDTLSALEKLREELVGADKTARSVEDLYKQMEAQMMSSLPAWVFKVPPPKDAPIEPSALAADALEGVDLSGYDFSGLDLTGRSFRGSNLTGAKLAGAILHRADFTSARLDKADLAAADLRNAILTDASLSQVNATGTLWQGARIQGANFAGLSLEGADFSGVNGPHANFAAARLRNSRFMQAVLPHANFSSATVDSADFSGADLSHAEFGGASARGTRFARANLHTFRASENANFSGADFSEVTADLSTWRTSCLDGACFQKANLVRASLSEASLRHTKFDRCNMQSVSFEDSELEGATLWKSTLPHALFDRANLSGATLEASNLYAAGFWDATLLRATWQGSYIARTRLLSLTVR